MIFCHLTREKHRSSTGRKIPYRRGPLRVGVQKVVDPGHHRQQPGGRGRDIGICEARATEAGADGGGFVEIQRVVPEAQKW